VKLYVSLLRSLAAVAAVLLGAMALLVTLDVVVRNVGLGTIAWVNEVSEYSLPVATLLIAPWLLHRNEHVRLDVLLVSLPAGAARGLEKVCDVIGIAICAVFVWYGIRLILDSARIGSMVVKTLAIPEWWQYALVPVCFSLLGVEFARRLRA
jgi:TRAP-type C4-dicarboxylate transport system permease small subunit